MSLCPGCGKQNLCAVSAGEPAENCWCLRLPFGLAEQAGLQATEFCYCQACLTTRVTKLATEPTTKSGIEPNTATHTGHKTSTGQKPG